MAFSFVSPSTLRSAHGKCRTMNSPASRYCKARIASSVRTACGELPLANAYRRRDGLRLEPVEFRGGLGRIGEVAAILVRRHPAAARSGGTFVECDPRDQLVRALGKARQDDDAAFQCRCTDYRA